MSPWLCRQPLCLRACGTPGQSKAYTLCPLVSPHSSASMTLCTSWWRIIIKNKQKYKHPIAHMTIKTNLCIFVWIIFTCSNATAQYRWWPGRSFDPEATVLFQAQKHGQPVKGERNISIVSPYKLRFENLWHWLTRPSLHNLFAAPSETDGRILAGKEPPDRGRLTRPQSRLIGWRQRVLMEWLSELLNLLQPRSPFTHFWPLLDCLVTAEQLACRFFWEKGSEVFSGVLLRSAAVT